jgi:hypothetical protein
VEGLIDKLSSKNKNISKVNPVKFSEQLTTLHSEYIINKDKQILKKIRSTRSLRNTMNSRIRIGNRIRYVRYADDWIIGIIGDKSFADMIKMECKNYLNNNLKIQLSEEKGPSKITHLGLNKAKFLGVEFDRPKGKESKIISKLVKGKIVKSRINHTRIHFYLPIEEMIKTFYDKGFIKKNDQGKYITNAITP